MLLAITIQSIISACNTRFDVVFLADISGSQNAQNQYLMLQVAQHIVNSLDMSWGQTQFALVTYKDQVNVTGGTTYSQ